MKKSIVALSALTFILALSALSSIPLSMSIWLDKGKSTPAYWAGYIAQTNLTSPQNDSVSEVVGSWVVPSIAYPVGSRVGIWIGIDGYNSSTVQQIGTATYVNSSSVQTYWAWYEMVPDDVVNLNFTVSPGDLITAEARYIGNDEFYLNMYDATQGWNFSTTQTRIAAQRISAEWVIEGYPGIPFLADFGTVQWTGCYATINGTEGSIGSASWQNIALNLTQCGATLAYPTSLSFDGTGFNMNFVPPTTATISPTSATVWFGDSQEFTSSIQSPVTTFSYQWYLDDVAVSGANNPSWVFTPSQLGNYSIHLVVWDGWGFSDTSNTASVEVRLHFPDPDVAITDVMSSKTIVGRGYINSVNVTVANQGSTARTFNVTVFANLTAVQTNNATVEGGAFATVTFSWNTTGFTYGDYTLSATAWTLPGEIDTEDNTCTGTTVLVTIPGDVNGDRKVDIRDLAYIAIHRYPDYVANADINSDGVVNQDDLDIGSAHYGQSW